MKRTALHLNAKQEPVPGYPCPCCGNRENDRSHLRHVHEIAVLPLLFLRPYRCPRCLRRFYQFSFSRNAVHRALGSLAIWLVAGGLCFACLKLLAHFRR